MTNPTNLDAALALSRFGLGARDGSFAMIGSDSRGALRKEVTSRALAMPAGPELRPTSELLIDLYAFEKQRNLERTRKAPTNAQTAPANPAMANSGPTQPAAAPPAMNNRPQQVFLAEVDARFNGTMRDPAIGFGERLTMFWANHFAIAASKGPEVRVVAGAFEREAIRPHVFGRFEDMLSAVETHPAMLVFLDNRQSVGPDSKASGHGKRGLNENLAREIMELHTLGVDGGYRRRPAGRFARGSRPRRLSRLRVARSD
jgi:uncharacterized protein (DUF1800 family)